MNTERQEVVRILEQAKELLQVRGWTNGESAEAKNRDGLSCLATAKTAFKFTPFGALKKVGHDTMGHWSLAYSWLKLYVRREYGCGDMYTFNNLPDQTVEGVIAAFDGVIAYLRDPDTAS